MTKVILHGTLAKKFGKEFELQIASPVEALRAIAAQIPEFKDIMQTGNYYVYVGSGKNKEYLTEDTITLNTNLPVHIVPEVSGGKSKGVGKLIAGIALMGVAFIPGLNAAAFGALGGLAGQGAAAGLWSAKMVGMAASVAEVTAQAAFMGGLSLALGGAAQMLAPQVGEGKESNLFNGAPDSVTEGTPVPLVYGEYLAMGYPVSFELVTGLNAYTGTNTTTGGGGNSGNTGGWTTTNQDTA